MPNLRCPEEANLRAPETVLQIHLSFIRAGAELIETNTFGANRRKLRQLFLEDEFEALNNAGVKLAREARESSGRSVLIAGSIGPLGELGDFEYGDLAADFAEQAAILEARGVDLFMLETFFDLEELVTAVEAVRTVSSLPIVAMMTFDEEGSLSGVPARIAGEQLAALGVAAMGANCGTGPQAALLALAEMAGHGIPLAAKPNIGEAGRVGGRVTYPHGTPDYFADFAAHARALGAQRDRRLLRHDGRTGRRDPHRARGGPRAQRADHGARARAAGHPRRRRRRRRGSSRRSTPASGSSRWSSTRRPAPTPRR